MMTDHNMNISASPAANMDSSTKTSLRQTMTRFADVSASSVDVLTRWLADLPDDCRRYVSEVATRDSGKAHVTTAKAWSDIPKESVTALQAFQTLVVLNERNNIVSSALSTSTDQLAAACRNDCSPRDSNGKTVQSTTLFRRRTHQETARGRQDDRVTNGTNGVERLTYVTGVAVSVILLIVGLLLGC